MSKTVAHCMLKATILQMNEPGGLCVNPDENILYVADTNNHCIRRVDLSLNSVEMVLIL